MPDDETRTSTEPGASGGESAQQKSRQFLEFFTAALSDPRRAVAQRCEPGKVSATLVGTLLGSILLSAMIVATFPSAALEADDGNVLRFLRTVNYKTLPAVAPFLVGVLALVLHGGRRVLGYPTGSVQDTTNALLALVAVLLPLLTLLVVVVARVAPGRPVAALGLAAGLLVFIQCWRSVTPRDPDSD